MSLRVNIAYMFKVVKIMETVLFSIISKNRVTPKNILIFLDLTIILVSARLDLR